MPDPKRPQDQDGKSPDRLDNLPVRVDGSSNLPARPGQSGMGDILLREKLVNMTQLQEAQRVQHDGENVGYALARLGYLEESHLISFLSRQYGVPSINLDECDVSEDVIKLVPKEVAERHNLCPIARQGSTLIVAMADPGNIYAMDDVKFLTGLNVEAVVASETSIKKALEKYYEVSATDYKAVLQSVEEETDLQLLKDEKGVDVAELARSTEDAPVVRLVNMILVDASSAPRPTSTSSRTRRTSASATASTACCTRSCGRRCACATRSRAVSRS